MAISIVVSFIVTTFLYKKYCEETTVSVEAKENMIYAPMQGEVKPIEKCSDSLFASKAMGDGVVVTPNKGVLVSPIEGKVTMIFPTKHTIGLESQDGTQILIHVGLDTVQLEGKPFEVLVQVDDTIKVGQKLMKIHLDMIKAAGLSTETAVVITNQKEVEILKDGQVKCHEEMMRIK